MSSKELRERTREFVIRALASSQSKRPSQKDIEQAVDKIVKNLAPIVQG